MPINLRKSPDWNLNRGVRTVGTTGQMRLPVSPSGGPTIVTSGLVLHLDAGKTASYPGSGTTWTDLSGNGNNATLINGPTYDSGNGGSILFDGGDDYASTGTTGFPFGSSAGTLSGWAKTNTLSGNWAWIITYGTAWFSQGRILGRNGSTYYYGGYADDISVGGIPINTWFHMTGVYTGTQASMYINGSLVSGPTSKSWNTISNVSYVGKSINSGEPWSGNIAQVLVYNRALTGSEILQNYDVDKARFGL